MNISSIDANKCTGCCACFSICPFEAIDIKADMNGFLHPVVNDNCRECKKCIDVCPCGKEIVQLNKIQKTYAVQCNDNYRPYGSSGGVFGALSNHVLSMGGTAYGAAFYNDCKNLKVIRVPSITDIEKVLKSKYVQSETGDIFISVKEDLESGLNVLYCGCPCQVAGLKKYLGKDYPNLLSVDFLCHGAVSPLVYNRFLDDMSSGKKIVHVDFRDKKYGWGTLIKVQFEDGSIHYDYYNGSYFESFLNGFSMRECCFSCPYSNVDRVGDITIGDFWGVSEIEKSYDDKKGTSLVMCNTLKGQRIVDDIRINTILFEEVPVARTIELSKKTNGSIFRPTYRPSMRDCFMKHIRDGDTVSKSLLYAKTSLIDVGILGWWIETPRSNYGSTLTCFSLYMYLKSLGLSVAFVSPPNFDRKNAGAFNKKYGYRMTAMYAYEGMNQNNKYIDTFVIGSDVLWYYNAFIKTGYTFLLDFVDETKRKISYSTSFGNTEQFIPALEVPIVKSLLKRFDSISVREKEAVEICKNIFDIESELVLDPVFLNELTLWEGLSKNSNLTITSKYIFAYLLDPSPDLAYILKTAGQKMGYNVISITDKQFNSEKKKMILKDCGILQSPSVEDFIYCLKNAEYIVTDSYHGMCFSIIFQKRFTALVNKSRGSSRFESLASLLNITENLAYDLDQLSSKINSNTILCDPETLSTQVNKSRDWLVESLNKKKVEKSYSDVELLYLMMARMKMSNVGTDKKLNK